MKESRNIFCSPPQSVKIKYITPSKIKIESFDTIEKLFFFKLPTIKAKQIPRNSVISGIIKLISVNSKGAIIAPGVTVVEIVPKNEKLIVEAKLPLSEIGYVRSGLNAKIRLNTPEGSRYRPLSGKVQFVGADRISTKNEEEGYYLVKVETLQNSFNKKNENFKLFSGVPVTVGIVIGKRSFLDYFLSPFKSQVSFALSER